jgi:Zn-dependent peptidase ImmA (M78 family)
MKKMKIAEFQAEELIKSFDFSIPINPVDVCAAISSNLSAIEYHEREFETENVCGLTVCNSSSIQIIVNSKITVPSRRLFTAAHEIGHVVLHILTGKNSEAQCSKKDIRIHEGTELEAEANQFASALLMPRNLIKNIIDHHDITWSLIENIALQHGTSLEATARRAIAITKGSNALIIYNKKKMWLPVKSKGFSFFIQNSSFPSYLEIKKYTRGFAPRNLKKCDVSDWGIDIDPDRYNCYYSSINFEEHDHVMTILSVEEKEYDEVY